MKHCMGRGEPGKIQVRFPAMPCINHLICYSLKLRYDRSVSVGLRKWHAFQLAGEHQCSPSEAGRGDALYCFVDRFWNTVPPRVRGKHTITLTQPASLCWIYKWGVIFFSFFEFSALSAFHSNRHLWKAFSTPCWWSAPLRTDDRQTLTLLLCSSTQCWGWTPGLLTC